MTEHYIMEGECVSGLSLMDSRICETLWVTAHKQYVVIFLSSAIFFFFSPVDFQVIKVRKHHQSLNTESRQCHVGGEWKTIFG